MFSLNIEFDHWYWNTKLKWYGLFNKYLNYFYFFIVDHIFPLLLDAKSLSLVQIRAFCWFLTRKSMCYDKAILSNLDVFIYVFWRKFFCHSTKMLSRAIHHCCMCLSLLGSNSVSALSDDEDNESGVDSDDGGAVGDLSSSPSAEVTSPTSSPSPHLDTTSSATVTRASEKPVQLLLNKPPPDPEKLITAIQVNSST